MDMIVYILIGIASRFLPHPANFTAVGGLAVFGGSRLPTSKALSITFITMLVSDLFLGFHSAMWATYLGMFLAVVIGKIIAHNGDLINSAKASLLSSVIFYLITNFAVWWGWQTMYPKNISGVLECYIAAIPFFRNSILGDLFYVFMFQLVYGIVFDKSDKRIFNKIKI